MIFIFAQLEALYAWLIMEAIPMMAIAYGLSYLGGKLFGQDIRQAEDEPRGQSFAWNPHTTKQEGIPRPMCYGRNLHYGNVVMEWTDVDPITGNEVLYKALDYGGGPVQGVLSGIVSDVNHCIGGTPTFNLLTDQYIDTWWQTAANVNDDDKTTYVGFTGTEPYGHNIKGKFESIVTFDSTTLDRLEYRRYWRIKGNSAHVGYEKIYLWYEAAYHLIATKNITTEGSNTDTIMIEAGGPWVGVTKIKIEVELSAVEFWFRTWKDSAIITYKLYELRAWRLEDVPVFLNGQPAHNFKEVIVRGRRGTLNQTCMEGFEQNKLESKPATSIIYGEPVRWTSPNNFFDDIEYTLAFLQGLFYYSNEGKVRQHSVGVKVEISERDQDDWTTLMDTTISAAQLKQLYKAYKVSEQGFECVHGTQYDLRFSKTTEEKSPTRYGDEISIRTIREVVGVAFTHPGRALLGIIAQATERLQGDIDVTWMTDDKLVQVYDAELEEWVIKFTRNRSFVTLAVATQPVISGDGTEEHPWTIERYEGLLPSRCDLDFFCKWADWCDDQVTNGVGEETEDRMPCDIICDQQTNVWSIAYEIAQIGRMYPYWRGCTLTGWIDKITDEPIDLITMDNTMARSWKNGYAGYEEMAGSVETFYKDAAQGYERKPWPVFNKNAGVYTRIIALEGVGVTSQSLAARVGNHALKRNELIKNINGVRMTREALRYKLGRVVRIQTNVPGWGQAFRVVESPTNNTCELDRVIENVSAGDLFWVKTYDTVNKEISLDSYTVQSIAGKVVTIAETWEAGCTPLRNHLAAIGVAGAIKLRRIVKMAHAQENHFDIELETYDTSLFDSDDTDPLINNPNYIKPVTELAIPITRTAVMDLIAAMAAPSLKLTRPQLFNCAWAGDDDETVAWSKRNPDEPILIMWEGETYEITPDSTTLEFIYWDSETPNEFLTTATATTALAFGMYLACTNKDGVEHPADMTQMQHGAIIQIGTLLAEQIIISGINALALMNAPAEAGADVTGGHQGDINIDNITDGTTYKKFTSTEDTKLTGIENSADVTANHADDVIYRGNTPPAHKAGRVWYCLVNAGYDNYTLYKSTGAAWQKIGDETAQHQADIQLANLGEKSVDSLTDGSTYARMLKAWRHTSDPTKLDLSLGFAASITTAQIGLLAVHTAQIDNLAVDTLQIKDNAVTIELTEYIADQEWVLPAGVTICGPLVITTSGGPIKLTVTAFYCSDYTWDDFWCFFREDGYAIEATTMSVFHHNTWSAWMSYTKIYKYTPAAGTYSYTVEAFSTNNEMAVGHRFFSVQEVKK